MNFPTHNDNACECPRCGEIELVGHKDEDLITYECENCHHEENQVGHWSQQLDDDEAAIQDFNRL